MLDDIQTKKKPTYSICDNLRNYLVDYGREVELPISYNKLLEFTESIPVYDEHGDDTLWRTVIYPPTEMEYINSSLTRIYSLLKIEGDSTLYQHLYVERIDYCTFGNSKPFRIRMVNSKNDNQDYFYIKSCDASRVYGLELEHLLSPNRMHYITHDETLIEEHIVGIPGDVFIRDWLESKRFKSIRLAKELVKFNERSFIRLLGDMRAYNFVVQLTHDFEDTQIRLHPMDFDQQSYSGRKNFYLPQYFKDNNSLVTFCLRELDIETSKQYQYEEHALIKRRIELVPERVKTIIDTMGNDRVSTPEKVHQLKTELSQHYQDKKFLNCENMGQIIKTSLERVYHS